MTGCAARLAIPPPAAAPRVPPPAGANPAGAPTQVGSQGAEGIAPPIRRAPLPPAAEPAPGIAAARGTPSPRQGYHSYLRTATTADMALVELPGVAGLMFLTFSGGVIGYRQASAGRMVRTQGAARFLP